MCEGNNYSDGVMFEWNNCWVNHTYDVGDLCKNLLFDEERRMKPRLIGPNKKIQVFLGVHGAQELVYYQIVLIICIKRQ